MSWGAVLLVSRRFAWGGAGLSMSDTRWLEAVSLRLWSDASHCERVLSTTSLTLFRI